MPNPPQGKVDAPLARSSANRQKMAIVEEGRGKRAVTHYALLQPLRDAALLECRLETGRTHQVRVHMASLAGAWIALVAGLGGMRDHDAILSFAPRLPSRISRLEFSLLWHGQRLRVDVQQHEVTYALHDADPSCRVELRHHGEEVTVTGDRPVTRPVPPPPPDAGPPPRQPAGRAPARRGNHAG